MHNMVYLIGRLCNDVTLEKDGDKDIVKATLAVQRSYKNEDGIYDTDFIDIILYNSLATHTAEYCKKGDLVGVKGMIQNEIVEDHKETFVIVDKVSFLASSKKDEGEDE